MRKTNGNRILRRFPDPRSNVFIMMRFQDTPQQKKIYQAIESTLKGYSLNAIRADTGQFDDLLWPNVRACMDASLYGIAVFEQAAATDINPNVSLEVGYMLAKERRLLLLKEKKLRMQTDLIGHLYQGFDVFASSSSVRNQVRRWLVELGIAKKRDERMLVFLSKGGTCRCAMAKAITRRLWNKSKHGYTARIESAALGEPELNFASRGARTAIRNLLGEDLLADHRPMQLTSQLKEEADLILVMDRELYEELLKDENLRGGCPPERIRLLNEFFGRGEGDITDPWPDDAPDSDAKYASCAKELSEILEGGIERITKALRPPRTTPSSSTIS